MNLAYVAGLVDGEGCIGFTQCRTNLIPRVCITNTNQELILKLQEKFGGCVFNAKRVKETWKSAYHWVVTSKLAIDFLEKIDKYLILKSNQTLCLYAYEAIRPGKGHRWSAEGREAIELLKSQIAWLNKKGVQTSVEPVKLVLQQMEQSNV
jgi:hypothetical protein